MNEKSQGPAFLRRKNPSKEKIARKTSALDAYSVHPFWNQSPVGSYFQFIGVSQMVAATKESSDEKVRRPSILEFEKLEVNLYFVRLMEVTGEVIACVSASKEESLQTISFFAQLFPLDFVASVIQPLVLKHDASMMKKDNFCKDLKAFFELMEMKSSDDQKNGA